MMKTQRLTILLKRLKEEIESYDDIEEENQISHVMNRPPPEDHPDSTEYENESEEYKQLKEAYELMTTVAKDATAQIEIKSKIIENQNKWITFQSRRTQNIEKDMVEISSQNKGLKEGLMRMNDIAEHLKGKVNTLQQQIYDKGPNAETQGETQQGSNQAPPPVIWRPPGHPPVEVDECVDNIRCNGNCEHVECQDQNQLSSDTAITCHDCKMEFPDKISMMDHKRDSDHPSKRKCNKPECERGVLCWYVHRIHVPQQAVQIPQQQISVLTCKDCQQVFTNRNDLMFHKKRVHVSNIICKYFLEGNCRRGYAGQECWYRHDQQGGAAINVARPQIILPPPGSTSWDQDFPLHPIMGQNSMVGLKHQMTMILQQQTQIQKQQQEQHLQQVNSIMAQLMNLNV